MLLECLGEYTGSFSVLVFNKCLRGLRLSGLSNSCWNLGLI